MTAEEFLEAAHSNPFWAARGRSIQAYANLEQALLMVMVLTTGMPHATAGTIFFKISSAQARRSILERLINRKFKSEFGPFWNSVSKAVHDLDVRRNEIVHWNAAAEWASDTDGWKVVTVKLTPPNFWDVAAVRLTIDMADLEKFVKKCRFYTEEIVMFCSVMNHQRVPQARALRGKYRQELVYPAPESEAHTRNRARKPDTPPQASRG